MIDEQPHADQLAIEPLTADAGSEAVAFLKLLDAAGWHNVSVRWPDGTWTGRTFEPGAWKSIAAFVAQANGRANVYYSANEPKRGAPNGKLEKEDIGAIRAVYVDRDPAADMSVQDGRAEIERWLGHLERGSIPPSFVVDSGGGYQVLWRLAEKLPPEEHKEWAESLGRGLADMASGDRVQNIDRVLRLPGTLNIPDEKKRAKGRVPRTARLVSAAGRVYDRDGFASVALVTGKEGAGSAEVQAIADEIDMGAIETCAHYEDLPAELRDRFEASPVFASRLWSFGKDPRQGGDLSGSGQIASLCAALAYAGFSAQEFGHLVHVWPHAEGSKEYERDPLRCLARTWANVGLANLPPDPTKWLDTPPPESIFPPEVPVQSPEAKKPSRFMRLSEAAGRALDGATEPLVEGLLDTGAMSVLYGDSNLGKSFVGLDIGMAIVQGRPWAGLATTKGPVAHVFAEGGRGALKRAAALQIQYGPGDDLYILTSAVNLLDPNADLAVLISELRPIGPILLVLDTLSRIMAGGDENSSVDMGALVRNLDRLREALGCHVMVVHHTGKDRAKGARGHSLLRAATDTEIEVTPGRITVTKQRDLEGVWSADFELRDTPIGLDAKGRPVKSATVAIVPANPASASAASKMSRVQREREAIASAVLSVMGESSEMKLTERWQEVAAELQ
jgi:hypothetical protein